MQFCLKSFFGSYFSSSPTWLKTPWSKVNCEWWHGLLGVRLNVPKVICPCPPKRLYSPWGRSRPTWKEDSRLPPSKPSGLDLETHSSFQARPLTASEFSTGFNPSCQENDAWNAILKFDIRRKRVRQKLKVLRGTSMLGFAKLCRN